MRERRSDIAERAFEFELHEPGPEHLQHQLVQFVGAEHLEHVVVQLVLVDAVQLELVIVFVLHRIEQQLQHFELFVRRWRRQRWRRRRGQLEQLQLLIVEKLGSSPAAAVTGC